MTAAELDGRPAVLNLRLYSGDTFTRSMQFTDGNGTGLDISTWTLAGQIREAPDAGTVLKSFTISVTSAVDGEFDISLTATEVNNLAVGTRLYWDLQSTVGAAVTTYVRGSVLIDADVTRGV